MGKRKRARFHSVADIDLDSLTETPNDPLASLSVRIRGEVEALQSLERAIDEDASDADEPVAVIHDTATVEARSGVSDVGMPQQRRNTAQDSTDVRWQEAAEPMDAWQRDPDEDRQGARETGAREMGSYVCNASDDVLLHAQLRRARDRRRKKRKKDFASFNLEAVNDEIVAFVEDAADSGGLELPDFSKMQRLQVSLFHEL